MCACAEQIFSDDDKKLSFIFYRNENQYFAWYMYTLIAHEWESYSKIPEIINGLPFNSKMFGGLLLRFFSFFLCSVYIQ